MFQRIFVVTEGQTETAFVKKVLASYFPDKVFIPVEIETKVDKKIGRMYKGGISNFEKIRNTLVKVLNTASKDNSSYVTTMFDFYGLPKDTPCIGELKKYNDPYKKVEFLEDVISREFSSGRNFFPYIQLHEFESLLYADLDKLQSECFDVDISGLKDEVKDFSNPELINNGVETAPSKRIIKYIPSYDKIVNGINAVQEIGMDVLCKRCSHFSLWIEKIGKL